MADIRPVCDAAYTRVIKDRLMRMARIAAFRFHASLTALSGDPRQRFMLTGRPDSAI
jgi:hypothetical protein